MKLIAYVLDGHRVDIRPAPAERDWMSRTDQRFAYRCLPLSIANAHGWELVCSQSFTAIWDGGNGLGSVKIVFDEPGSPAVLSHFGHGILTFHISCIFRTEPGYDLLVQGPVNQPKDAIAPLTGIIETDWAPYSFTMNWLFTQTEIEVRFEKGEAFCSLFPLKRGEIEAFEPEIRPLSSEPELSRDFLAWRESRTQFNAKLLEPGSVAQQQKWQKLYHQGLKPDGTAASSDAHRTRVRLRPFRLRSP
jgi:Family of unknown function (DUF6065)